MRISLSRTEHRVLALIAAADDWGFTCVDTVEQGLATYLRELSGTLSDSL
jgi:hypothetical protein